MTGFRLFAIFLLGATALVASSSCNGGEFSSAEDSEPVGAEDGSSGAPPADDSGTGGGTGGASGSGGAAPGDASSSGGSGGAGTSDAGVSVSCRGPEDCNDGDPCTVDLCGADFRCIPDLTTCGPVQQCCDGNCGQCCSDADCDDGIICTVDTCTGLACVHTPDDTLCAATAGYYCSPTQGCRPREYCSPTTQDVCDDLNPCTTDRCDTELCYHDGCPTGTLCCPDLGCAACCSDSQCEDGDPCTRNTCNAGTCATAPLCGAGQECCAAGSSATCGACCDAGDCDDGVGCTIDSCAGGACSHVPNSSACAVGQTCDPAAGCITPAQCATGSDCPARNCETASCQGGQCAYAPVQCGGGLVCCSGQSCQQCCGDSHCNDNVACTQDSCVGGTCSFTPNNALCQSGACDPALGCIQCTNHNQCDDGDPCTTDTCSSNSCSHSYTQCPLGLFCWQGDCVECRVGYCDCSGIYTTESQSSSELIPIPPDPIPLCGVCRSGICEYQQLCEC